MSGTGQSVWDRSVCSLDVLFLLQELDRTQRKQLGTDTWFSSEQGKSAGGIQRGEEALCLTISSYNAASSACDLQALLVSAVCKMKMLINTEKCYGDTESHTRGEASAVL